MGLSYPENVPSILASTADYKQAGFNTAEPLILTKDAMALVAGRLGAAIALLQ